jgi:O-antigen/teichoic acid export membrane protein
MMIGILIACRWPLSFYSGGLIGLERQVVLAAITTVAALLSSIGAVIILSWVSPTVLAFFTWQICVNLALTVSLTLLLWQCMPDGLTPYIRFTLLRRIWGFAGGTTGIAIAAMILTDLDKIVVSKRFSLEIFGYYSLAWRVAGGLSLATAPVFNSLYPALCRLVADDHKQLSELYQRGCQLMSFLTLPAATIVVLFGRQLIFGWTGDAALAARVYPIAAVLTAGSALNTLAIMPFALQLAYGWTRLALSVDVISILVSVPLLLAFTSRYGAIGAAVVWLLTNLSYLFTYIPLSHRHLLKGDLKHWYLIDVGAPLLASAVSGCVIAAFRPVPSGRLPNALSAVIALGLVMTATAVATPFIRRRVAQQLFSRQTALAPVR